MEGLEFSFPRLPPVPVWCGKNSGLPCAPGGVGCRFWLSLTTKFTREDVCGGGKMVLGPRATRPIARALTSLESQPNPAAHSTKAGTWIRRKGMREKRSLGSDSEPQAIQQIVYNTNTGRKPRDGTHCTSGVVGPGSPDQPHPIRHGGYSENTIWNEACPLCVMCPGGHISERRKTQTSDIPAFSQKKIKLAKEICSRTWDEAETRRLSLSSMSQ